MYYGIHLRAISQDVLVSLTHWGRVTHICVGNLTIIGPDNGLSPGRRQAIIWSNAGILLIGAWGTNFSEILIGIHTFSFNKMRLKMSSAKWRPFCLGLNVLTCNMCLKVTFPKLLQHLTLQWVHITKRMESKSKPWAYMANSTYFFHALPHE